MAPSRLIPPSPDEAAYRAQEGEVEPGLTDAEEPFALFAEWFKLASTKEPRDANAMALATADAAGLPDVRMVLLKDVDAAGFVFFTNTDSAKGRQLAENAQAALCMHWKSLNRQVRARGPVSPVGADEADAYFATRARDSRIGAWASAQSRPLPGRFALEAEIAKYAAKFGLGDIPRPPHWSGYRLAPLQIEFWRERPFRLHDRLQFARPAPGDAWIRQRLYP